MRARSRTRSIVPLVAGFLLLVGIVLGALWLVNRQERSVALIRRTLAVQNGLGDVLSHLQDARKRGSAAIC